MLRTWFLPHPETHKKAHLLSWEALLIYLLLFIFLQVGFDLFSKFQPGILGVSSNISQSTLIELTNQKRAQNGLASLRENSLLDQAAEKKAKNMFEEDYWAHFAPSGKDPWGFISGSGYKYSYAGENLAKNFQTSDEVVEAWMNSPSHKDNIINSRYQEIGIAVIEGVLQGQTTTLVVQMFATPITPIAHVQQKPQVVTSPVAIAQVTPSVVPSVSKLRLAPTPVVEVAGQQEKVVVSPFAVTKNLGLALFTLLGALIIIDLYLIRRRVIHRFSSKHLPHLIMLGLATSALMSMRGGSVL